MRQRAAAWAGRVLVSAGARTWRIHVAGGEHLARLRAPGAAPVIFALWHGHLLPLLWHHRCGGATLLVSAHRDSLLLVRAARRWGYGIVRGSSTRGAVAGLRGLVRVLQAGRDVAFAADGPRGPAGVAKPGTVAAAQLTGAAILPVGVQASHAWWTPSWDRFLIPRPFARVAIVYGVPFRVAPGRQARAAGRLELERRLHSVSGRHSC